MERADLRCEIGVGQGDCHPQNAWPPCLWDPRCESKWRSSGYELRWKRKNCGILHVVAAPAEFWQQPKRAVLSSRMGRLDPRRSSWLHALGELIRNRDSEISWLTADGTTCDQWLRLALSDTDQRLWRIRSMEHHNAWGLTQIEDLVDAGHVASWFCVESPSESAAARGSRSPTQLADWQLLALADEVDVLHLRRNGRLVQLLQPWLSGAENECPRLVLLDDERLVPTSLLQSWPKDRVTTWKGPRTGIPWKSDSTSVPIGSAPTNVRQIVDARYEFLQHDVLSHWTRAPSDRWPDETAVAAAQRLLFDGTAHPIAAIKTLERILTMGRVIATSHLNRAGAEVVCFTARKPFEFRELRRFRPHLRRWDFEPYGLSICREWLVQRGAAPVVYGDEQLWNAMPRLQRPWFQLREDTRRANSQDWSIEAEWRCCGDVNLQGLPPDKACVFVPDQVTASHIVPLSRWPVVYLGDSQ